MARGFRVFWLVAKPLTNLLFRGASEALHLFRWPRVVGAEVVGAEEVPTMVKTLVVSLYSEDLQGKEVPGF